MTVITLPDETEKKMEYLTKYFGVSRQYVLRLAAKYVLRQLIHNKMGGIQQ